MMSLRGQPVLILGLGQSGLAMARWCARCGAQVSVADTRERPPQLETLRRELPDVRFLHCALDASLLQGSGVRAVFKSPGIKPAEVLALTQVAREQGLWLGGELSLFAQALAGLKQAWGYSPQLLAVTGTNGKTTVTSLTAQLIARAGKSVVAAGNIGPSLLDTLMAELDGLGTDAFPVEPPEPSDTPEPVPVEPEQQQDEQEVVADQPMPGPDAAAAPQDDPRAAVAAALPQVWVLELSSFQLEDAAGFEPTAATVLNLSQDHLDWHGSMEAYVAAKEKVFGAQALMLLNRDDPLVMALRKAPAPVPEKGKGRAARVVPRGWIGFGSDLPQRAGDFGLEEVNGMVWLVRSQGDDETRKPRKDETPELHLQRLMPADALRISGRHNALNALAALALAGTTGCSLAAMLYGLREYRGEPHRVQSLGVLHDVEYFDDSKGTNVGATVAALNGLGAERRLVVILGGEGKGQDFAPLAAPVARHARAAVLIGRDADLMASALQATGVPLLRAESMEQAVQLGAGRAQAGDAVLLSPACASFDMFDNYEHRAQQFALAVQALADEAGAVLEGLS